MLTHEQRREMIDQIRNLPAQLEALVSGLSEAQLTTPYMEGEWTVAQNVHHLADAHINAYVRMKLLLTEDKPAFKTWEVNVWAEVVDSTTLPISTSLNIIKGLHARWVTVMDSLDDTAWARYGLHPEAGEISAERLLQTYSNHGLAHLDQIKRTLAAAT